jgi:hypothetical protein
MLCNQRKIAWMCKSIHLQELQCALKI